MQPGSLLNSRPIFGLRWYGFGNVTFAAYATTGCCWPATSPHRLLAGGPAAGRGGRGRGDRVRRGDLRGLAVDGQRLRRRDRADPAGALAAAGRCPGSGSPGPGCWLVGGSAVLAIGADLLAGLARGPDRRSHLGNFVQRIIDGDALDVVSRKAVASAETIVSPLGIGSLVVRRRRSGRDLPLRAARGSSSEFSTAAPVPASPCWPPASSARCSTTAGSACWLDRHRRGRRSAMAWFVVGAAGPRRAGRSTRPSRRPPVAWPRGRHRRERAPDPRPGAALGRAGAEGGRVRPDPRDPRPPADLVRAGHVLGDVVRALLVQVLQGAPAPVR